MSKATTNLPHDYKFSMTGELCASMQPEGAISLSCCTHHITDCVHISHRSTHSVALSCWNLNAQERKIMNQCWLLSLYSLSAYHVWMITWRLHSIDAEATYYSASRQKRVRLSNGKDAITDQEKEGFTVFAGGVTSGGNCRHVFRT